MWILTCLSWVLAVAVGWGAHCSGALRIASWQLRFVMFLWCLSASQKQPAMRRDSVWRKQAP